MKTSVLYYFKNNHFILISNEIYHLIYVSDFSPEVQFKAHLRVYVFCPESGLGGGMKVTDLFFGSILEAFLNHKM